MQFLLMSLFALGIVAADQLSKWWVVSNICPTGPFGRFEEYVAALEQSYSTGWETMSQLPEHLPVLPGVVRLSHTGNDGAAFSAFSGMQWLFVVLFAVLTAALVYEYFKKPLPFTKLERWLIAAVYAGGVGNMIDRVRMGFVVDMIEVEFMEFAVFNVADCFITCGCILLMIHLIFFNKQFWKDEKK